MKSVVHFSREVFPWCRWVSKSLFDCIDKKMRMWNDYLRESMQNIVVVATFLIFKPMYFPCYSRQVSRLVIHYLLSTYIKI